MFIVLFQAEVVLVVLVFVTISFIISNDQCLALPYFRNSAVVSHSPTVQVVEVLVTINGSHGHNTYHLKNPHNFLQQ